MATQLAFGGRAPVTRRSPARNRRLLRSTLEGWGFVAPATVIILGLSIFPAGWAFVLSLQNWNGFAQPTFVGGDNYAQMLGDAGLWDAVGHTLLYTALFVPASLLLGLFLAVALNRKIRFVGIYRTAIFVPFVVSAATTGVLTNYLFDPQFGIVNNFLRVIGIPPQGWLTDPTQAMLVIAIMSLWGSAAFTTVIYLAALQDVPNDLIEAATVDGAGRWQIFWRVIWPELTPVTVFAGIWQVIQAIQLFDLVYTTTRGGPLDATKTVVYYLWDMAFHQLQFGYGSAVAYGLFGVTLLITIGIVVYSRRSKVEAF
ncbi:MAG: sugar ABC transporter permease [Microbacteriaceae bacterium]|nr:MAG: sugar ABC transporter permease [Microbacteriaceae bacterium]